MKRLLNTLYVLSPGAYLRLEGETIVVEVEHIKRMQVPLIHLSSIVVLEDNTISAPLLGRCMADGRSVVFLDRRGAFMARVEGPTSGNVLLRRAQFALHLSLEQSLELAKRFVAAKIRNCRQVLLRGARESSDEADKLALQEAAQICRSRLGNVAASTSLAELDGVEGETARNYFGVLERIVKPSMRHVFTFTARTRRPPRDRMNACCSFIYTLLTHDCRSALEGVGLDPQIGFLHTPRPGRPALALDLVEEFRAYLGDRFVLKLINLGQLTKDDFETFPGGAVLLSDAGRKKMAVAYQERKQEEVLHPVLKEKTPLGLLPHIQARLLSRFIRGDIPHYPPFLAR